MAEKKEFMSNVISDSFAKWNPGDKIIMNGGTGSGKSSFALEVLSGLLDGASDRMLILCNRSRLKKQLVEDADEKVSAQHRRHVDVFLYQEVENIIRQNPEEPIKSYMDRYKYIVVDECHYFWTDAGQNDYTDLVYEALLEMQNAIVIYCSATAEAFFDWLIESGKVKKEHAYYIAPDYSYVEQVVFYKKNQLRPLIDQILKTEKDTKIVVFVASAKRMKEMHEIYGDSASYVCSKHTSDHNLLKICDNNCIHNETFEKRLLFATSALDNGVNLRDRRIRHMITELYDIDGIRQSLGRKRVIDDDGIKEIDTCKFYIRIQLNQDVNRRANISRFRVEVSKMFRIDHDSFIEKYMGDRTILKRAQVFYTDIKSDRTKINRMKELSEALNLRSCEQILSKGFMDYIMHYLGKQLADKVKLSDIHDETNFFIRQLKKYEKKRIYKKEQEELKELFIADMAIQGGNSKRCGMNERNKWLAEKYGKEYHKHFINKDPETGKQLKDRRRVLEDGTENKHRDDSYWLLC